MPVRKKAGALTAEEKPIVKALLARKWRNQDIQDLLNRGRAATVNSARITEVMQSNVKVAGDDEVVFFIAKKKAWDSKTGLNLFDDERLLRARVSIGVGGGGGGGVGGGVGGGGCVSVGS